MNSRMTTVKLLIALASTKLAAWFQATIETHQFQKKLLEKKSRARQGKAAVMWLKLNRECYLQDCLAGNKTSEEGGTSKSTVIYFLECKTYRIQHS